MILKINIGAYVYDEAIASAVEEIRSDRLLFRSKVNVSTGGVEAAVQELAGASVPHLLIIESQSPGDGIWEDLGRIAEVCSEIPKFILISPNNDVKLYKELISQGIDEYMVPPVSGEQIKEAIERIFSGEDVADNSRTIAFMGVRGGMGSSTLAHNTAYEIVQETGKDAVVVDMDLTAGTAALNFNVQPKQTIADALSQSSRLDPVIVERLMVEVSENVSLLASPALLEHGLMMRPDMTAAVIRILRQMYTYVVIDLPYIWNDWTRETLLDSDEVILVTQPSLICMRDTKNMIEFLGNKRGVDAPIRLMMNRTGEFKKTELNDGDFKEHCGKEVFASLPYDPDVFGRASTNGEMLSLVAGKGKIPDTIRLLAQKVSGAVPDEDESKGKGVFGFLSKK